MINVYCTNSIVVDIEYYMCLCGNSLRIVSDAVKLNKLYLVTGNNVIRSSPEDTTSMAWDAGERGMLVGDAAGKRCILS